jgi:hypothetical protein
MLFADRLSKGADHFSQMAFSRKRPHVQNELKMGAQAPTSRWQRRAAKNMWVVQVIAGRW